MPDTDEMLVIPDGTRIVQWHIPTPTVPRDILAAALGSKAMSRDATLLRDAIAIAMPRALLRYTAHEKAVCVVDERKGTDGNTYSVNMTLEPERADKSQVMSLGWRVLSGQLDSTLRIAIHAALLHVIEFADAGDAGRMLIRAVREHGGAGLGAKGGAYLLPASSAAWWAQVKRQLEPHVECNSLKVVPDAEGTAAAVAIVARRLASEACDIDKSGTQRAAAVARTASLRSVLGDAVAILDSKATAISIADQLAALADQAAREIADESI